jgi:hypothetical protein
MVARNLSPNALVISSSELGNLFQLLGKDPEVDRGYSYTSGKQAKRGQIAAWRTRVVKGSIYVLTKDLC